MPRDDIILPSQISGLSEPTLFIVILTTFASNPTWTCASQICQMAKTKKFSEFL